ncbi:MAG TPA: hypothetical protein VK029_09070, partial [Pseudogracilibacillus sp.]|nr:hypothetical protein [Pseudogracilibacillus sp.]
MSYTKDCITRYLLKTLYDEGIRSEETFRYLTKEDFRAIATIAEEDIATLQKLQQTEREADSFASFRIEHIEPPRMASFFKRLQIHSKNILQTNLLKLTEQTHITKGRVDAFFQFKHECLRATYNDTLHPKYKQEKADVVESLLNMFFSSLKQYISTEAYEKARNVAASYVEQ